MYAFHNTLMRFMDVCSISFLKLWATLSLCARNLCSPNNGRQCLVHPPWASLLLGHPFWTSGLKGCMPGSSAVACWNSAYFSDVTERWYVCKVDFINFQALGSQTLTSRSGISVSVVSGRYDPLNASATERSTPGRYLIFKSCLCRVSIIFCSLGGVWCKGLFTMYCSGLRSDYNRVGMAFHKWADETSVLHAQSLEFLFLPGHSVVVLEWGLLMHKLGVFLLERGLHLTLEN